MQGALGVGHLLQLARGAGCSRGARHDADGDADNDDDRCSQGARHDADGDADNNDHGLSRGAGQDARAARAHLHGQPDHQEGSRLSQKRTSQVSGLWVIMKTRVFEVDCQVCPHHVHGPKTCVRERSSLHRRLGGEHLDHFKFCSRILVTTFVPAMPIWRLQKIMSVLNFSRW